MISDLVQAVLTFKLQEEFVRKSAKYSVICFVAIIKELYRLKPITHVLRVVWRQYYIYCWSIFVLALYVTLIEHLPDIVRGQQSRINRKNKLTMIIRNSASMNKQALASQR